jgi:hypothetical protein
MQSTIADRLCDLCREVYTGANNFQFIFSWDSRNSVRILYIFSWDSRNSVRILYITIESSNDREQLLINIIFKDVRNLGRILLQHYRIKKIRIAVQRCHESNAGCLRIKKYIILRFDPCPMAACCHG